MDNNIEVYLSMVKAINNVTDDLIVSGSIAQFLHLNRQHRIITDLDIILFNRFDLVSNLKYINQILNENYNVSSYKQYSMGGYGIKLVNKNLIDKKEIRNYISIDVKYEQQLHTIIDKDLRILKFEQLLANKLSTILIGDNCKHYIRIKDFYDFIFLSANQNYDFDLVVYLLCNRLIKNDIHNIFSTFLFSLNSELVYKQIFESLKEKYGFGDEVNLLFAKHFLEERASIINQKLFTKK